MTEFDARSNPVTIAHVDDVAEWSKLLGATRGAGFRHQSSGVGSNPTIITRRLLLRPIGATVARQIPVLKVTRSNRVSVTVACNWLTADGTPTGTAPHLEAAT